MCYMGTLHSDPWDNLIWHSFEVHHLHFCKVYLNGDGGYASNWVEIGHNRVFKPRSIQYDKYVSRCALMVAMKAKVP